MSLALPVQGVWIGRVSETSAHPLDAWVVGVREGSEEAFRHVYDATVDGLVSFAYGMVGDRKTAEDIVQQSFVELVAAAPKFKGDGVALRAWLYKSTRFGCLDEYRRRSRRPEIPSTDLPERHHHEDHLEHHLEPDLERALDTLSARSRSLIILRHVVGLSGEEIASVMKMTRRSVYAALSRAEKKLRAQLGEAP